MFADHKKYRVFKTIAILSLILLLSACASADRAITPTPAADLTLPSATAEPVATLTLPATPSPTSPEGEKLLDWQPLPQPPQMYRFALGGDWLVTLASRGMGEQYPLLVLLARKMDWPAGQADREIFSFPEGKTVAMYEVGSGMEVAGGRLAFLLGPMGGDSTFGYELWLIDLQSGKAQQMKSGDRALPGIALSERWLAVLDSSTEQHEGERCVDIFSLPDGVRQRLFCTPDPIRWPVLSGDWLTFLRDTGIKSGPSCLTIEMVNLATGEQRREQPQSCVLAWQIDASESLTVWTEVLPDDTLRLRGRDAQGAAIDLERSRMGFPQVCGDRVIYLGDNQGARELRAWQPGGEVEVLHRFRPRSPLPAGIYSQDETLPQYDLIDFQCGLDWVVINATNQGFLAARIGSAAPALETATHPPSAEPILPFPIAPGTTWVYTKTGYSEAVGDPQKIIRGTSRIEERVADVQSVPPYTVVHIEGNKSIVSADVGWQENGRFGLGDYEYWYVIKDNQVYLSSNQPDPAQIHPDQMRLLYQFPLQVGAEWCPGPEVKGEPNSCFQKTVVTAKKPYLSRFGELTPCYEIQDMANSGSVVSQFCEGIGLVAQKYDHAGTRFGFALELIQFTKK